VHRIDTRAVAAVRIGAWVAAGVVLVGSFVAGILRGGWPTTYGELRDTAFDAGTFAGGVILVITLLAALAVRVVRRARA
jgi:hypothetical protein